MAELVYCVTVAFTNLLTLNGDWEKPEDAGSQILAVELLIDLGNVTFAKKPEREL